MKQNGKLGREPLALSPQTDVKAKGRWREVWVMLRTLGTAMVLRGKETASVSSHWWYEEIGHQPLAGLITLYTVQSNRPMFHQKRHQFSKPWEVMGDQKIPGSQRWMEFKETDKLLRSTSIVRLWLIENLNCVTTHLGGKLYRETM